jgi:uncharacterized protein (DUF58 family)
VTLLEPDVLARLESLQLQTRSRLAGKFGGDHRSLRYGNTVDFADFREYHPGDDYRRIDYHVLARLDQLLIKLYEANDEIVLRLLFDTSASMRIGGKLEQAKRIAAALGFVALTAHDTVTVHTFPQNGRPPRFTGRAAIPALFSYLESLTAEGPTPFAAAAAHLLSRSGPPGVTAVISDVLTPDWENIAHLRARGSDLVVLHLLANEDTAPGLLGDLELVHPEGRDRLPVSLTPDQLTAYMKRVESWRRSVADRCHSVGAVYVAVDVDADVGDLLLTTWRNTGVVR